jgi:ribonucleoside-diphosphate reductase alpha chain
MTVRRSLPATRDGVTHRFSIADVKGYVTVGCYEDGRPGEVFLTCKKVGSLEHGLLNALGLMISTSLQYGVPLERVVGALRGISFDPAGVTKNPNIPFASSVCDYLAKWLEIRFLKKEETKCKPNAS